LPLKAAFIIMVLKQILVFIFFLACNKSNAGDSTSHFIKINFLYGSKPAKGYKGTETKFFGGMKGGHVDIEAGDRVLDFMPGDVPLFPKNKNPTGGFQINRSVYWDTASNKWTTVIVPLSSEQYAKLQMLFDSLPANAPYDYAVFGMRCAAASYDVLSRIGLFKKFKQGKDATKYFYPKLLRKKILKWAAENNFTIINHEGRQSRKWESDKGVL
jgi:hypothetical protein